MSAGPVLFLDIDDVLCLNSRYGGYDVIQAVKGLHHEPVQVYRCVFAEGAKAALMQVHAALDGQLRYVISSTWRRSFNSAQMASIFRETGLRFVAERLEPEDSWCTPFRGDGDRAAEVAQWLEQHPDTPSYAVLDDTFSGYSLREAMQHHTPMHRERVVLCDEHVGLLQAHVEPLFAMLRRPVLGQSKP